MDSQKSNGDAVRGVRVAVLTLTFDMETGRLQIGGSVPSNEFAKGICCMAADEFERKISAKRATEALSIASADFLTGLPGVRG
jgi:hypothetical protein